jgi:orotate phosphoribosyltransferase
LITAAGGELVGVVIALDRQERIDGGTAVANLSSELAIPVTSILTLQDVIEYLDLIGREDNHSKQKLAQVKAYQAQYCQLGT